jgi:outer membrane murein-binding lipoprotein Lpp
VEEAARRLEQLAREENRPELSETARQLRQAADSMRQASANGQAGAAQAQSALERLQEAQKKLQQSQTGRAQRDIADAQRQADEIAREHQQIAEGVRGLDGAGTSRQQQVQQLSERKESLESKVAELEKQLDSAASDMARTERDASRRLSEAAGSMRDNRLRDKIRYSRSMIRAGVQAGDASNFEQEIGSNIGELQKKIGEAAAALGQTKADPNAAALEKAQQLARGMESLDQRMRERTGRDQGNQSRQGGQGGRNDGSRTNDGRGGDGDTAGGWQYGDGSGDRRPGGRFNPEDVRQFRGEIRQWTREAEQLRRMLQGAKIDPRELDDILRNLRALDDDRVYKDVEELARLQSQVNEGLKRFEYGLRRRLEGNANQVLLSGSDEVPEQFRKLVEQYYRSLSKPEGAKPPEKKQ